MSRILFWFFESTSAAAPLVSNPSGTLVAKNVVNGALVVKNVLNGTLTKAPP